MVGLTMRKKDNNRTCKSYLQTEDNYEVEHEEKITKKEELA